MTLSSMSLPLFFAAVCFTSFGCDKGGSNDDDAAIVPVSPLRAIMSNIASLASDTYNLNWVGKPCQVVNKTTTCPAGGNITITGSFTCPSNSEGQTLNLDFTYAMTDCANVFGGLQTTFTGTMTHTGSSTNSGGTVTYSLTAYKAAEPVHIVASGKAYEPFDQLCTYSITSRKPDAASDTTMSGVICESSFSN